MKTAFYNLKHNIILRLYITNELYIYVLILLRLRRVVNETVYRVKKTSVIHFSSQVLVYEQIYDL